MFCFFEDDKDDFCELREQLQHQQELEREMCLEHGKPCSYGICDECPVTHN